MADYPSYDPIPVDSEMTEEDRLLAEFEAVGYDPGADIDWEFEPEDIATDGQEIDF